MSNQSDAPLLELDPARAAVFLDRVEIQNYRSIQHCDVALGPLTILVGPNGSGKSNFLDAIHLIADALNTSLDHALRERGGIGEVRRRSSGRPTHFRVCLRWHLEGGVHGTFQFRVGAQPSGGFQVQEEECRVIGGGQDAHYQVREGEVVKSSTNTAMPPATPDRLYLVAASGIPVFRPVYDALSHMGFYNLNPDAIRELQAPDPGEILRRDGSNLASVLGVLKRQSPEIHSRVIQYLSKVSHGIESVESIPFHNKETIEFRQRVGTNESAWRFSAENMSDGTLRALGVLAALFQSAGKREHRARFVGIEEPETAVHPGAAAVLRDALRDASRHIQVAVTSHSPELLDDRDIAPESVLSVKSENGASLIQPLGRVAVSEVRAGLATVGELLRTGQALADDAVADASGEFRGAHR